MPGIWPGCCIWGRSSRWRCPAWSRRRRGIWCGPAEDVRGDLMSARHRLSKLLLRQGLVYCGGRAWTGAHERWLGTQRQTVFDRPGLRCAFDTAYDTVLATTARRDRLDTAIAEMAAASEF